MSNSKLVTVNVSAHENNYTLGRDGKKIEMVTIHHMAGILSAEQCGAIFQNPNRQASAHYGVGKDGEVGQYIDEANTAWANANWDSNCKAVTVETSNCEINGQWKVSDVVLNKLIELVADIAKRNKLGKLVKGQNLTWHSMYAITSCPGEYLLSKIDYIVEKANEINGYADKPAEPVAHKYKIGDEVVFSSCYTSSTAPIEEHIPANKMARNHGVITKIVEARNPYLLDNGLCWVNDGDIRGYYTNKNTNKNTTKNINAVADAVIRGEYGNGQDRVNKLIAEGYDPNEVQALVNKKLGY